MIALNDCPLFWWLSLKKSNFLNWMLFIQWIVWWFIRNNSFSTPGYSYVIRHGLFLDFDRFFSCDITWRETCIHKLNQTPWKVNILNIMVLVWITLIVLHIGVSCRHSDLHIYIFAWILRSRTLSDLNIYSPWDVIAISSCLVCVCFVLTRNVKITQMMLICHCTFVLIQLHWNQALCHIARSVWRGIGYILFKSERLRPHVHDFSSRLTIWVFLTYTFDLSRFECDTNAILSIFSANKWTQHLRLNCRAVLTSLTELFLFNSTKIYTLQAN